MGQASAAYLEKLRSPEWQKMRLQVFERDKWTCRTCDATDKTLHVHHVFYRPGREPWDYPLWAFLTLCADCHEGAHENQRAAIARLIESICRRGMDPSEFAIHLSVVLDKFGERQFPEGELLEMNKFLREAVELFESGVSFSAMHITNPQPADEPTI